MKKTLKELIEMARSGQKFEARMEQRNEWLSEKQFYCGTNMSFKTDAILALWEVRMKREPRVLFIIDEP